MPGGSRAALVENLTGVMPEVSRLTQAEVIYPAELLTVSTETLTGWSMLACWKKYQPKPAERAVMYWRHKGSVDM